MNLALWLSRSALKAPEAPALFLGPELVATYADFHARACSIAADLRDIHRIEPGHRVAILLSNSVDYLPILFGIWLSGAVAVPINAKLHPREALWIIDNSGARLTFVDAPVPLSEARPHVPCATTFVDVGGADFTPLTVAAAPFEAVERGLGDIAWLFYTSGTTGRPKGVMLSHGNLLAMSHAYLADVDEVRASGASVYAAPLSHGAGLYSLVHVLRGSRHVLPRSGGFDPAELLDLGRHFTDVSLFAAPTMVRRLVSHARATGVPGDGLRTIVYGGGPMYLADIEDAVAAMGSRFVQIYGQGECPMTITTLSRELVADRSHPRWRERLASVGTAHSCVEVRVADEDGREVPRGSYGEVLVKGAPVMLGYWNNPAATAEVLRGGWLATGDLGVLDEDGFLTLKDRSRDVIISGGVNIYPREVEEALLSHPDVAEASVVGRPNAEWGEDVFAFVVPRPGALLGADELDAHCLAMIARFKRPKAYAFETELPKNNYGKVLKTTLRERLTVDA